MELDDIAVKRSDEEAERWMRDVSRRRDHLCKLASAQRPMEECTVVEACRGSFNLNFTMLFPATGEKMVIRVPIHGRVMHPEEKLRNEVETLRFLTAKTTLPVPEVISCGKTDFFGPYMITNYLEGTPLNELLCAEELDEDDDQILRDDISDEILAKIYRQVADIMLELYQHDFDHIGSLKSSRSQPETWTAASRPVSLKMNEMIRCGGVSAAVLDDRLPESTVFSSSQDYLVELAKENIVHFEYQRNSAANKEEVRQLLTSRHLFCAMTPDFVHTKGSRGPFKLHCDDFRPANILVNQNFEITAVLDWEFSYAAPLQFLCSPPRWLLLKAPHRWVQNSSHMDRYLKKLDLFIHALEDREQSHTQLHESAPLSRLMRQSMEDGTFWFHEAAKNSWDADAIYWWRLDKFYWGDLDPAERVRAFTAAPAQKGCGRLDRLIEDKREQLREYEDEIRNPGLTSDSNDESQELPGLPVKLNQDSALESDATEPLSFEKQRNPITTDGFIEIARGGPGARNGDERKWKMLKPFRVWKTKIITFRRVTRNQKTKKKA